MPNKTVLSQSVNSLSTPRMSSEEITLREQLGIPLTAERVIIFGETSHWDPNWLLTSEEYYQRRIVHILDAVLKELSQEPRRIFAIESLFFLRLYWEREPQQRELLHRLINERRLRLTGTGLTTPDTLLPTTEAILRDYLLGQEWLRKNDLQVEPRLAYLPDDFGHSPALPSILQALGFDWVAITRIDGMYFIGSDYRAKSAYPLAGSSAELLLKKYRTLDFVWCGRDSTKVLCHWNAFTYFQGDMLAHVGIFRWMGMVFGSPWRTCRHIARRIKKYIRQLQPLAQTPYMFCPIGCDFNPPIHGLVQLLDRYNRNRYPQTGVWAVNAGMDDYMALVNCHRQLLPIIEFDPNPYWMGFYATRPEIKQLCNRISRKLTLAEGASIYAEINKLPVTTVGFPDKSHELQQAIKQAWDLVAISNHHDFITGTTPDRVWQAEQRPWLLQAEALTASALENLIKVIPTPPPVSPTVEIPQWKMVSGRLEISSKYYQLELSEDLGGCIVSFKTKPTHQELLAGPANDLVLYQDWGGLWRLGHEFRGGRFKEILSSNHHPAKITVAEKAGKLEVRVDSLLEGNPMIRFLWMEKNSPFIRLRIIGAIPRRRTITCRFPTIFDAQNFVMDVPGGLVQRPRIKLYQPTFWPIQSFFHLQGQQSKNGLAVFLGGPMCASLGEQGTVEWIALRNAPKERAFRILPIPAHPAAAHHPEEHVFDYAIWFTSDGVCDANQFASQARSILGQNLLAPDLQQLESLTNSLIQVNHQDVFVIAMKKADRGGGYIVRLMCVAKPGFSIKLHCTAQPIQAAYLCDARERDWTKLIIADGKVNLPITAAITSIRIRL